MAGMSDIKFKLVLLSLSAIAFLTILLGNAIGEASHAVSAPLFALVAATALIISLVPSTQTGLGKYVHMGTLFLSAASGLLAAWSWFLTIEGVAPVWNVVAAILMLMSAAAVLRWIGTLNDD